MKRFVLTCMLFLSATVARAEIDIQEITTPGGIKAWLVEEPSIPFVALELRFRGGASLDAKGKRGATNLMVGLLEEGAGDLDAQGFAKAAESIAARYSFDVGDDAVSISAQFLTEKTDESIDLLRSALITPSFAQSALDRVRGQVLSGLRSDATDPDTIAGQAFDKLLYGDHPYASALDGTVETVTGLTREDIQAAHKAAFVRDRVYVSATGDISADELAVLLDRLLADLPQSGPALPPRVDVQTTAGVEVVPFDTPQSVAMFGHGGMTRDHPDFFAAYVLNVILGGGGFEARLMTEVREKRGLTYGVYSYLVPRDFAEVYLGRVASANDRIAEAIEVIQQVWADTAENGVTQDELDRAKTYLTGGYALRFDGNRPIARILVGMQMDGLGRDYVLTRNANIEAVTLEDVKRVAGELLKPEALQFVVVGQPEGL